MAGKPAAGSVGLSRISSAAPSLHSQHGGELEAIQKSALRAVRSADLCHTYCISPVTAEQTYEITIEDDYIGSED